MIIRRAEDLALDAVLQRREAIIAVAIREVSAAALHADWLVMAAESTLAVGAPEMVGALVWRMGTRARKFLLAGPPSVNGVVAMEWEIADSLVPEGCDPMEWTESWVGSRSGLAFDVAAALVRSRGGDPLERALFAWLFATGEPQEGLRAFLEKRAPRFPAAE